MEQIPIEVVELSNKITQQLAYKQGLVQGTVQGLLIGFLLGAALGYGYMWLWERREQRTKAAAK